MIYINIKNNNEVETVDKFETIEEALEMVKEYNLSDKANYYYINQHYTKEWRDSYNEYN